MCPTNPKLLVIDSNEVYTKQLKQYLQTSGYHVTVESSPISALKQLSNGHCYHLVIIEVSLTEIRGLDLLDKIRLDLEKDVLDLPVIMLSEEDDIDSHFSSMHKNANAWIKRATPPSELEREIEYLVGKTARFGFARSEYYEEDSVG